MTEDLIQVCKSQIGCGLKWLDENYPNWYEKVDTEKLQMETRALDILGYLYGNCDESPLVKDFEEKSWTRERIINRLGFYGFAVSHKSTFDADEHYKVLTDIWKKEILERRPYDPFNFLRRFENAV